MANLYLDVDGVLLGRIDKRRPDVGFAPHGEEFLEFAVNHFDCYWLTTHCQGDSATVTDYLSEYVPASTRALLARIKPTRFRVLKTEALSGDFYWLEDKPLGSEMQWLQECGLADRWLNVNINRDRESLGSALVKLKGIIQRG